MGGTSIRSGRGAEACMPVATIALLGQESTYAAASGPEAGPGAQAETHPAQRLGEADVPVRPRLRRARNHPPRRSGGCLRVRRWRELEGVEWAHPDALVQRGAGEGPPAGAPRRPQRSGEVQLVPAVERPALRAA